MNRSAAIGLLTVICVCGTWILTTPQSGHGQRPAFNSRAELGSRVTGERTVRQAEVSRLQNEIDDLSDRVDYLERQGLMSTQLTPSFTVSESEAAVSLAEAKLEAALAQSQDNDPASKIDVAASRLALLRAQSQLRLSRFARTDGVLALETDIAFAERRFFEETQTESQLVRLVAKGYTSIEGLNKQKLDTAIARKNLERVKKRLELFREASGLPADAESPSDQDLEPAEPTPPATEQGE